MLTHRTLCLGSPVHRWSLSVLQQERIAADCMPDINEIQQNNNGSDLKERCSFLRWTLDRPTNFAPRKWTNLGKPRLHKSSRCYVAATGKPLPVLGMFTTMAIFEPTATTLTTIKISNVSDNWFNLLGRSVMRTLGINVNALPQQPRRCALARVMQTKDDMCSCLHTLHFDDVTRK